MSKPENSLREDGDQPLHDGLTPQPAIKEQALVVTSTDVQDIERTTATPFPGHSQALLHPMNENTAESESVSAHKVESDTNSLHDDRSTIGRPSKCRRFKVVDCLAMLCSTICLVVGVVVLLPTFTISWHMGFQNQIIAIGFLIGVMNLCAERVIPACFLSIEARYGRSRLQNYDAILTNKVLSSQLSLYWRVAIVLFLALPLALSVGYKRFLGGTSSADLTPWLGMYGISFPNIGEWAPIPDPIYLQVATTAAFQSASANDTPILNGSNHYPLAYGYNVLLLSNESAALLDVPRNDYIEMIRSKLWDGETWRISASVNAYVATRQHDGVDELRTDEAYWQSALNSSSRGLISYYLRQDANTYIGMLAIPNQPYCWMGIFRGGPPTDDMYSKSTDDANVVGFRKMAELFTLSRQRCQATWQISASSIRLVSGICPGQDNAVISQEPVLNAIGTPWEIEAGPALPHFFYTYAVIRPNSTWLMPTYAVTITASYWARGVYEIYTNPGVIRPVFNYTGIDERITSTRQTLDPAPALFVILAVQPVITLLAFLVKSLLSLPFGGNFGLVSVLAGIKRSTLDVLGGAGFSGELNRPVTLEVSLMDQDLGSRNLGGLAIAAVRYELKVEKTRQTSEKSIARYAVPKAHGDTIYV